MGPDLCLTLGILLGLISVPSLVSAFSDSRPPRAAVLLIVAATALIATATTRKPGGYRIEQIPDVILETIGAVLT
ncbi:hypothetical protein RM543_00455 [Roseicyclus sp. F158]|uniref:50S ribosomal protein L35 n=1 Tax=Tropicimonas omnivorans TaxID=3075590 RepID=A0ABU3DBQ5_9RHOB|nr:hypothetical protein [Roseicyclus sp. F158]MDT0681138.1 hypothetical protein [Roseicyclus sp. F158]